MHAQEHICLKPLTIDTLPIGRIRAGHHRERVGAEGAPHGPKDRDKDAERAARDHEVVSLDREYDRRPRHCVPRLQKCEHLREGAADDLEEGAVGDWGEEKRRK
jgi:hypothetical protein